MAAPRSERGLVAMKEKWGLGFLGFWGDEKGLRADGRRDMVLRKPRKRTE